MNKPTSFSSAAGREATRVAALKVFKKNGETHSFDIQRVERTLIWAAQACKDLIDTDIIIQEVCRVIYDGITENEIADALILSTVPFIEHEPAYGLVASRLLLGKLYRETTGSSAVSASCDEQYRAAFIRGIQTGVARELLDSQMLEFDLSYLAQALVLDRDRLIDYMGMRTLYERYFLRHESTMLELPQAFWMRVAMGLSYHEDDKNKRAVEFYHLMSQLRYVPGTPTLLHSGLLRPQLSSCFLSTIGDDLHTIFECLGDNAQLSKWSGGVANDWTSIRATGSMIKSIKTESQGVVPFLKINNDVTASINRSGKRRAATVVYLETWHMDVEDFLDLRRNTGDERRRTHDINTANWVPDLFMQRVEQDGQWTLFSPNEVPDLHHIYGKAFQERYEMYEQHAREGKIRLFKIVNARQLWRKMLSRLFETGHPWITFKDPCNVRSPQDHVGVVHSSNLCTEITLNTSVEEIAVCNLGSVNVGAHVHEGTMDYALLATTVETAIRMLDNVIDINFYPVEKAQRSNMRHRPVGLGAMGFQDALFKMNINFGDTAALEFADELGEQIAYHAILASSHLARERGAYSSYTGSKWDRGIFPQDTIALLERERGESIPVERKERLDWSVVRQHVKLHGMRNSNTMAIAPTATISNISGCFPCIEPIYKNIYVKANMSGEFTVVNKYLIEDLKAHGLWNQEMLDQLKYFDGNLQMIPAIPSPLKEKYKEAFEIDPLWLIKITAVRGKWIDQSQSHNVFMQGVSGKKLEDIYLAAWKYGLKTTYYLRTLGATQIEKSTLDAKKFGFTQKRSYTSADAAAPAAAAEMVSPATVEEVVQPAACSLEDPSCESCQ